MTPVTSGNPSTILRLGKFLPSYKNTNPLTSGSASKMSSTRIEKILEQLDERSLLHLFISTDHETVRQDWNRIL